jgi:Flp pilus assembly protein TadD
MDDFLYVNDPLLGDPQRLWKAWFQPGSFIEYYPVEETIQWLQWQLCGKDTLGYHITNVALNIISAFLVWRLLSKFHLRSAWIGGLLFIVHPVQVESVAWIAELKNTLSTPPLLLAMCAWMDYKEGAARQYWLALAFFLLAMLCKIAVAPLPLVLCVYEWWKSNRFTLKSLAALIPFFGIAITLVALSYYSGLSFEQRQLVYQTAPAHLTIADCLFLAGETLAFYLEMILWPSPLLLIYPKWQINAFSLAATLPWVILAITFWVSWRYRKSWGRTVFLGAAYFVLMLLPVLGLFWISYMKTTWVMNHFLYTPLIGPIGLFVAALTEVQKGLGASTKICGGVVLAALIGFLSVRSFTYSSLFVDPVVLWSYMVANDQNSATAHTQLGAFLTREKRTQEAIREFRFAVQLDPGSGSAHIDLGTILTQTPGFLREGIAELKEGLKLQPDYAIAYYNLGVAENQVEGGVPDAIAAYSMAVKLKPDFAVAYNNLGNALIRTPGRIQEGVNACATAIRLDPKYAAPYVNIGMAYEQSGQLNDAIKAYAMALQLNPNLEIAEVKLDSCVRKVAAKSGGGAGNGR